LVAASRLVRIYSGEGVEVTSSARLDLLIAEGELTALIGAAGSGKSTLVNILAGLDTRTAGTVRVAGHNLGAMTARERLIYRRSVTSFIWQQTSRNLLPYMTARQNVLLPMQLGSVRRRERRRRANFLLDTLASRTAPTGLRTACPAVSSSAPPSPRRWPTGRSCCWPTSPPASWTPRRQVTGDGLVSGSAAVGTTVAEFTGPTAEAGTRFQLRSDWLSCD
jgi:ABC transporter